MRFCFWLVVFFIPVFAQAHPVTFQGGTAITFQARPQFSRWEFNYSFRRNWAFGVTYQRLSLVDQPVNQLEAGSAQLNWLVRRWNLEDAQGNFYLMGGGGYGRLDSSRSTHHLWSGAQLDYETRQIYTALKGRLDFTEELRLLQVQGRLGFAPFLANTDDLNVWFVVQADHAPAVMGDFLVTPLMRFFYRTVLWEFGASTRGDWFLTLMTHF